MQKSLFYWFGRFIYRFRWPVIGLWIIAILACLPYLPNIIAPFKVTGFIDEHSLSAKTQDYLDKQLHYHHNNRFLVIYHSKHLVATDPLYIKKIKQSLSDLQNFPIKHEIIYPDANKKQISKDKHTAYAVIILKLKKPASDKQLNEFKAAIKTPQHMTIKIGGEPIFVDNVNEQTQIDLYKTDFIATPFAIITMIFVFGSIVASFLPIILGGGCAILILTTLYFLGHVFTLSIFTLNIALLLGLCLSLDYALFIISRFRDELDNGREIVEAIALTQATAGKAIFFSGLAVFASLSALFFFPINILFSVAVGGLTAVGFAVLAAILLLPAILAVLKEKINFLSVRSIKKEGKTPHRFWHAIAKTVVSYPVFFFISILLFLLLLGYPTLSAKFGVSDYRIFPQHSIYRQPFDTYSEKFNKQELTPILLTVETDKGSILSHHNISKLVDLTKQLKRNPLIKEINSIVTTDKHLSKAQYYTLYHSSHSLKDKKVKQLLATTTGHHFTVISIVSKYPINSPETQKLVKQLRLLKPGDGLFIRLSGTPVSNIELLSTISRILPYATLWIMVFTYLILLVLLRSLFLPLKAILMNLLSLSACFGALILVFQEGHLHQLLNFEPQGMLDISLLVIIFCALFGFSMDYEVFLLTRIKESFETYHDHKKSIIFGIEKSSRIITSAAIIVIVLCLSFLTADVLIVKAFGLGIAVAIFVDAFLIRSILVPATMILIKKWNWYLPKWLKRLLPIL